jgi:hypothetical protein
MPFVRYRGNRDWIHVLPDLCQLVFQLVLLGDYSIFPFPSHISEESEVVRREIRRVNRIRKACYWRWSEILLNLRPVWDIELSLYPSSGPLPPLHLASVFFLDSSLGIVGRKLYWLNFFRGEVPGGPKISFQWQLSSPYPFSDKCCFHFWRHVCRGFRVTVSGLGMTWESRFIFSGERRKSYGFIISQNTQKPLRNVAPRPSLIVRPSHIVKVQTPANDVD